MTSMTTQGDRNLARAALNAVAASDVPARLAALGIATDHRETHEHGATGRYVYSTPGRAVPRDRLLWCAESDEETGATLLWVTESEVVYAGDGFDHPVWQTTDVSCYDTPAGLVRHIEWWLDWH